MVSLSAPISTGRSVTHKVNTFTFSEVRVSGKTTNTINTADFHITLLAVGFIKATPPVWVIVTSTIAPTDRQELEALAYGY